MTLPWGFSSDDCPIVYHYTSIEAARAMLESQTFWLSEYTALNDPSEFAYARGQLFGLLQRREIFMDTIARYCVVAAVEGLSSNTGLMIGSFTARRDDLGQWRSYANNGRGCVLGLETRYLEHDAGVAIRTVVYDEELVSRMLKLGLGVVQEQYAGQPDDPSTLVEYGRHLAADLFTIKHPCFADEREVRISRMLVRGDDGQLTDVGGNRTGGGRTPTLPVAVRSGTFGETRYVALPLTRDDGSSAIVSVGLGPTMEADAIADHTNFFTAHGLDVWKSNLPYRA
jgi:hypothetical protein